MGETARNGQDEVVVPSGWALIGVVLGAILGYPFPLSEMMNIGTIIGGLLGGLLMNELEYQWLLHRYSGEARESTEDEEEVAKTSKQEGIPDQLDLRGHRTADGERKQSIDQMKGVVLAAGKGTRLLPLTEDKPKAMVEIDNKPILTYSFEQLVELGAEELLVVVGYEMGDIIEHYKSEFQGIPITYVHQRNQNGTAHALLAVEEYIDGDFMVMLGDNIFNANLPDVVDRQQKSHADAAFLVEEVPYEKASRYGVCDTNEFGEITDITEKPEDPPTNLVTAGFYVFTPAIFHACHLVRPSNRREYELSEAIDLLIQSGCPIDAIRMNGWRADIDYPEDRRDAEQKVKSLSSEGIDWGT